MSRVFLTVFISKTKIRFERIKTQQRGKQNAFRKRTAPIEVILQYYFVYLDVEILHLL